MRGVACDGGCEMAPRPVATRGAAIIPTSRRSPEQPLRSRRPVRRRSSRARPEPTHEPAAVDAAAEQDRAASRTSHDLQELGEAARSRCPTTVSTALALDETLRRRDRATCKRTTHPRRQAPPDAVHRQADARAPTPSRCARRVARRAARPRHATRSRCTRPSAGATQLIAERRRADALDRRAPRHRRAAAAQPGARGAQGHAAASPAKRRGRAYRELFQFIKRAATPHDDDDEAARPRRR